MFISFSQIMTGQKRDNFLIIIPSRYASTRLPGKALLDIAGKSMIQRVYEACQASDEAIRVCIATDDERILQHAKSFQAEVFMTSPEHTSGTDRIAELADHFPDADYIINVQGDEPFIKAADILLMKKTLLAGKADICTLIRKMDPDEDPFNKNVVKVVIDKASYALYFSRSAIPYQDAEDAEYYQHIGMYGFTRKALLEVTRLAPGRYEKKESLEQLRWLENGYKILTAETKVKHIGIDTPEDLERARQQMEGHPE